VNKKTDILVALLITMVMTACSIYDDRDGCDDPVETSLSLSVANAKQVTTRQTSDVTQANGYFRGLTNWLVIPFEVRDRKITVDDLAKRERLYGLTTKFDKTDSRFFYTEGCEFMNGVASFLVYARAIPTYSTTAEPTNAEKSANGSLTAVFPADMNPIGITFTPEAIYGRSTADDKANALASYLTAIANTSYTVQGTSTTYKWSNFTTPAIKAMYQNFIGQENVTAIDIAASSTNVLKYVNALYQNVNSLKASYAVGSDDRSICEEIQETIKNFTGVTFSDSEEKVTNLGDAMSGYPANIGLPDGAAVVRWETPTGKDKPEFVPQTQTTTMDNVTGIARYAYPAELYYYTNSLIKTSTEEGQKQYYTSEDTWAKVLSKYEYDNGVVTPNTKAVAIIDPLQYGVAHLQVMLKKVETTTVKDAADADITIGTSNFPLTAIIVGNQHPVAFDFKPNSTDAYFMYDPNVTSGVCLSSSTYTNSSDVSAVSRTLVLQSNDDEEISLVLEFQNNSTQTIEGVNHGLIYPGTKFYLVAKVKPEAVAEGAEDYEKRVFTQDRTTTMTMKVESLAKAYNILPNLLSPRLEIGVQVVTKWMQVVPTDVMLE
jgi:hypothetical protein